MQQSQHGNAERKGENDRDKTKKKEFAKWLSPAARRRRQLLLLHTRPAKRWLNELYPSLEPSSRDGHAKSRTCGHSRPKHPGRRTFPSSCKGSNLAHRYPTHSHIQMYVTKVANISGGILILPAAHLVRQQDVLPRLRHRPVRNRHDQDRPICTTKGTAAKRNIGSKNSNGGFDFKYTAGEAGDNDGHE